MAKTAVSLPRNEDFALDIKDKGRKMRHYKHHRGYGTLGMKLRQHRTLVLLAAALLLHACGGSSTPADSADAGPPAVDAKGCTAYGAPPRPLAPLSPDGLINDALSLLVQVCNNQGGDTLDWTDSEGTPRHACLITPKAASTSKPLPMLVWLHPTLFGQDSILATGLLDKINSANLSGDASTPGFILLLPLGRNIQQFLPAPLNTGVGWDHWYRNVDRSSPYLNVDFATIDHFIAVAKQRGNVVDNRVYVSGWSEGADMGSFYGLNTPGVAATGVYSTTSPFDDPSDPCPTAAFALNNKRPFYLMARACDIGGACPGEQQFLSDLRSGVLAPSLVSGVILDSSTKAVNQCNAQCDPGTAAGDALGQLEHITWPRQWNDTLLEFMRDNPE